MPVARAVRSDVTAAPPPAAAAAAAASVQTQQHMALQINANNQQQADLTAAYWLTAPADVTLTTGWQDLVSMTVTDPGWYQVFGVFDFDMTGAGSTVAQGRLTVAGAALLELVNFSFAAVNHFTVTRPWIAQARQKSAAFTLQVQKSAAAGTLVARKDNSAIYIRRFA